MDEFVLKKFKGSICKAPTERRTTSPRQFKKPMFPEADRRTFQAEDKQNPEEKDTPERSRVDSVAGDEHAAPVSRDRVLSRTKLAADLD